MTESEITGDLFMIGADQKAGVAIEPPRLEARLVDRIREGDEDAFNELYRMFAPMVHGIILARVGADNADDILQEVFISAFRNIHSLRDKNAVGGWLAMIARNRSVEMLRTSKPLIELSEELEEKSRPKNEANEILSAIRTLPNAYKETLVLRLVEGMTGPEIARATGLAPESVRVNLHRGMKMLRQKLGIEVKQ
jgi:RNA polymerase sigma-70 factor (ECF subfamily)